MAKTNSKVDTENEKSYLTIEEFNAIRKMDFPKDFLDFLEIGFRTGLRAADILNLKKENIVLTKNDDGSLTGWNCFKNKDTDSNQYQIRSKIIIHFERSFGEYKIRFLGC